MEKKLRILISNYTSSANALCRGYPQFHISPDCPFPGWCLEMLDVLLRAGQIPHEFVMDTDSQPVWGDLQDNGLFSGIYGRIESGEVDTACLTFQKSVIRLEHFDFSVAVAETRPAFLMREIPVTFWNLLFTCLKPYDAGVWCCMIVCILAQTLLWTAIGRSEVANGQRPARRNGQYFAWDIFTELFYGGDNSFFSIAGMLNRLVFSVFQVGLFKVLYTGLMLAAIITPPDMAPIKSTDDVARLVQSGSHKLVTNPLNWFAQEIEASSEQIFVDLRAAAKNNPIIFDSTLDSNSAEDSMKWLNQTGYIVQTQYGTPVFDAAAGNCHSFVFSKGLPFRSTHFIFRKGSHWLDKLNTQILRNYPMIEQVYKRYFEQRDTFRAKKNCTHKQFDTPGADEPLNFWSVSGIFVLAACGFAISLISLVVEIIVSRVK